MSTPATPDQVLELVYRMHRATELCIERFTGSLPLVAQVDTDLLVTVKDLIADLYFLQVSLGITADFYGRELTRSRRGDAG
ncbi:hypothetical protein [Amycolatopsis sp. H20-H5]|uniref:hypothetical protein n=1 Tax=Amycolatopsis sp. H20-H5 TaxID=3046309 RepID=UPI002DBDEDC5|nr:hypothetical protein [Amycolatopsis sp. H20-H5]MEC3974860.1 hypothetical protein [Amycolatopsis sp. H20-H5]